MASFKQGSIVISEKGTPVVPTNPGEVTVVARGGELYKFDGVTETILGGVTGLGSAGTDTFEINFAGGGTTSYAFIG